MSWSEAFAIGFGLIGFGIAVALANYGWPEITIHKHYHGSKRKGK